MFKNYYEMLVAKQKAKDPKKQESEQKLQEKREIIQKSVKDVIDQWMKENYSEEEYKKWVQSK